MYVSVCEGDSDIIIKLDYNKPMLLDINYSGSSLIWTHPSPKQEAHVP